MPIPPIPPPLEHLGNRKFSYPPILNIDHNEWTYRQATWSEILVTNAHSGQEVWVPRRFLGEVSRVDDPVLIVGLNKELEYSAGAVWPHRRRVIEMPVAVNDRSAPMIANSDAPKNPAPVIGIRLEPTEARAGRMVAGVLTVSVVGCMVIATIARQSQFHQRVTYTAHDQSYFELNRDDDYFAVVRKLGQPASDHWSAESAAVQYRVLAYPARGYTVVLFGPDRNRARYIGTLDAQCNPVHGITYPDGGTSAAMLRSVGHAFACEAG